MAYRDRLPGGLADKRRPSDFDQKELRRGIKVELEHTNDPEIAREIAMDHLTEDRAYYEKLAMIEKNLENPIGGVGTALIVGGIALVGYLLFSKKSAAKPAAAAPAACTVDAQKLDRWGQARGFPVIYFALAKEPPTPEEFFTGVDAPVLDVGEQAVAVLADGSFWYYTQSEVSPGVPLTGRADNLRADYCSFPDQPPPRVPPDGGTVSGTLGQSYVVSELYPETSWKKGARQFWFWHSPLRHWQLIKETIHDPYFPGALATSTHLDYDLEEFAHVDYDRYAPYWVAEVWWIFADGTWHFLDEIVESPQVNYSGP